MIKGIFRLKISVHGMPIKRIRQFSVSCHGYKFTIATKRSTDSVFAHSIHVPNLVFKALIVLGLFTMFDNAAIIPPKLVSNNKSRNLINSNRYKGPVKLIPQVKIGHSFLFVGSTLFHFIILSLCIWKNGLEGVNNPPCARGGVGYGARFHRFSYSSSNFSMATVMLC